MMLPLGEIPAGACMCGEGTGSGKMPARQVRQTAGQKVPARVCQPGQGQRICDCGAMLCFAAAARDYACFASFVPPKELNLWLFRYSTGENPVSRRKSLMK